ncbi:protein phosphatase Mn(2+)-dependent 1K-like [Neosynchiropus ocellatus]
MLAGHLSRLVNYRPAFKPLRSMIDAIQHRHLFHNRGVGLLKNQVLPTVSSKLSSSVSSGSSSNVGSASLIGRRRTNEDRFKVSQPAVNILYFAVFDGHGGREAADFCAAHMEEHIKRLARETQNLEAVLTKAFIGVDKDLAERSPSCQSGTTATVALLRDNAELVVASAGDSQALLCREGRGLQLTTDHTPERKEERERIESRGGFIVENSCGGLYVNGRLAMTRSIGDFELKEFGVIAEPEVKRILLSHERDSFLALITDGISVIMRSQEICSIITQSQDPHQAAQRVCDQALAHGSADNVTIVIVPLGCWGRGMKLE